jgi:hypothetical protein
MAELHNSFISKSFLRSVWAGEYDAFRNSPEEAALQKKLKDWAERKDLKELSAEAALIEQFFRDTWGYSQSGQDDAKKGFTLYPKYAVKGAGEKGGTGAADLAIGYFGDDDIAETPQVLCEFKDIKSGLDASQKRKGSTRSPAKQCIDYLTSARRGMFGTESILPTWGVVTDMNEFRLYWFDRAPQQSLRFVIRPTDLFQGESLIADNDDARFERFLFWKVFHRESLLTSGGKSKLAQLIGQQWVKERELENEFYAEYSQLRERLYNSLIENNPKFPGTKGRLVRLAQKILDRCIFIFFCEDMGQVLKFPPQLLRDFLIHESRDEYFDLKGDTIWTRLKGMFRAMNDGSAFGMHTLNQFNGGLFEPDAELEALNIPNDVFCFFGQGTNEASLNTHKQTLLYLSAAYNYASGWAKGVTPLSSADTGGDSASAKRNPSRNLGLYMLGRIFEQSITELEILEAEADGLPSINKENKRKRDGVYYTPEWVVEKIVSQTLRPRLEELKQECGWPKNATKLPTKEAIDEYRSRLTKLKIVDPACGSGAFLITTLRFLLDEWHALLDLRREVTGDAFKSDDAVLIRDILKDNLYGVDINPASVEITRLALWLHTARGDKPLSTLDHTIRDGNSLIDGTFYKGVQMEMYDAQAKERVNAFDWKEEFPEVFEQGGFDAVVGNPPYVKLQNFRKVYADMADYLRNGRPGYPKYRSTQTGNFDVYLAFIERGLQLLNKNGRLGYIAPSLWTVNEYGEGLRGLLAQTKELDRWIDFKSFQVFEEVTTYTALQFYSKSPQQAVQVAQCPDGIVTDEPWATEHAKLPYAKLAFGDRWLLLTGAERAIIDKLYERCSRLDDPRNTSSIFVGIQTSADAIYHLQYLGAGRYLHTPKGKNAPPPYEVEIEDAIMKPLISGADAKRYVKPKVAVYLLFPYELVESGPRLVDAATFAERYPKAWRYLTSFEAQLRDRENGAMNLDDGWWAYNYPKNLDKQQTIKLIVPRLVAELVCSVDEDGEFYLDNVDVGGLTVSEGQDPFFIAGILNGPVANFVFKASSKPFRGNYRSANKQFIAPLPVPPTTKAEKAQVVVLARRLQELHSQRRDVVNRLARRMETVHLRVKPETWLFPTLQPWHERMSDAPSHMDSEGRRKWAKDQYDLELQSLYDGITQRLMADANLDASVKDGELLFQIGGVTVIDHIFVEAAEEPFVLAQWKLIARQFPITEKTDGKKLCNALRKLASSATDAVKTQIIDIERELESIEQKIAAAEAEMNDRLYELYELSPEERRIIEKGG